MKLSVIIVSYNAFKELRNCLISIYKHLPLSSTEIIVVDNNSNKMSVSELKNIFPEIELILLNKNIGFARANNIGVKKASADYLLFLNPDTVLVEDFTAPLMEYIDSRSDVGACSPMLIYQDGNYQTSSGRTMGLIYEFLEASMLISLVRKLERKKLIELSRTNKAIEVGWVSAACMLLKKEIFLKAGGFSTEYFLNYEDIDLCRKLKDLGLKNYCFPGSKCIHLDHRSFETNYELLVYSRYMSRLIYADKYYNMITAVLVRFMHLIGLFVRILSVNFVYKGKEFEGRKNGYVKALKVYLDRSKLRNPLFTLGDWKT